MILIRHGQTEFNRIYSATREDPGIRDPGLTDIGRREAAAAGEALLELGLRRLITSPYRRALETAELIAAKLGLPITVDTLVAERFALAATSARLSQSCAADGRHSASTISRTRGGLNRRKIMIRCSGARSGFVLAWAGAAAPMSQLSRIGALSVR